jgi:hypothetical protein
VAAPTETPVSDDSANLTVVPAGATIKVDTQNLGSRPGRVSIVVGNLALPGVVANWSDNAVNITLPSVEVSGPVRAKIVVRRADGSVANETPFELAADTH